MTFDGNRASAKFGINNEVEQANLASNNNLTLSFGKNNSELGTVSKLLRNLFPIHFAKSDSMIHDIRMNDILADAEKIKKQFPSVSEDRALYTAIGFSCTNAQAENITSILSKASNIVAENSFETSPLSQEVSDEIFDGAKKTYDEKAQFMWAELIAQESCSPGKFSKRSISILSSMSSKEAAIFRKLCTYLLPCDSSVLILNPDEKYTFNNGSFTYDERNTMESLGIVNSNTSYIIYPEVNECVLLPIDLNKNIYVRRTRESNNSLSFGPSLTVFGNELALLCKNERGTFSGLEEQIRKSVINQGYEIVKSE